VAAGQKQVAALLASADLAREQEERVARVGATMARLVHCKAVLLLQTDVRQSATRAGIWRAQQCLQVGGLWHLLPLATWLAGRRRKERLHASCCDVGRLRFSCTLTFACTHARQARRTTPHHAAHHPML